MRRQQPGAVPSGGMPLWAGLSPPREPTPVGIAGCIYAPELAEGVCGGFTPLRRPTSGPRTDLRVARNALSVASVHVRLSLNRREVEE